MSKNLDHSRLRLILFIFVFSLLLTACTQTLQANIPTDVVEIRTPSGFDQGMELTTEYLICPIVPETTITMPPPPYDEDVGDCALIGKSQEIEIWLTALEQIALSCQSNLDTNWATTLTVRDRLANKVNELEQGESKLAQEEDATNQPIQDVFQADCLDYPTSSDNFSTSGSFIISTVNYTDMLMDLTENVEKYCKMINELVMPLWLACDEINYYQENCSTADFMSYHHIIESQMEVAQTNYEDINYIFTNNIQLNGWEAFRNEFSESSIDCPLNQAIATPPSFTFYMNTFCRKGPTTQYEKVATFLEGQDVQIEGRNQDEPRWWWVLIPETSDHCWVSDATGSATGEIEDLEFIQPPLLIIKPTCSNDLDQEACEAAGGFWQKDFPTPHCDCS
jgi:hypothetical protein